MTRRGQRTIFQDRLEIIERATAGESDPLIASSLGCSIWTVRKWRRRGQRQGRSGLTSQIGRPTSGPLSTIPSLMRDAILHMRRTHPGWRPDTLLAEFRVDPRWTDQPLPSRARVAALLKSAKLTRRYRQWLHTAGILRVTGMVQQEDGVMSVLAWRIAPVAIG